MNLDELEGLVRGALVFGDNSGHGLPDIAHLIDGDQGVVLHRVPEIGIETLQIISGHHSNDTRAGGGSAGIDGKDACVGIGASQNFRISHAHQLDVADIDCLTRDLYPSVPSWNRVVDDVEFSTFFRAHPLSSFSI